MKKKKNLMMKAYGTTVTVLVRRAFMFQIHFETVLIEKMMLYLGFLSK